jgi:hypothetical protein
MSVPTPRTDRETYTVKACDIGFKVTPVSCAKALEFDLAAARALINRAVDLMTPDQIGKWEGVRAWLEQTR